MKVLTVQTKAGLAIGMETDAEALDDAMTVLGSFVQFTTAADVLCVPVTEIAFVHFGDAPLVAPQPQDEPADEIPGALTVEEMRQELAAVSRYVDADASDEEIAALYAVTLGVEEPSEVA